MGRLIITEEEKKNILSLYGLIRESIDPNKGGSETIQANYKGGYYTVPQMTTKNQLDELLTKVKEFVKKNGESSLVNVNMDASESQLPNYDMEGAGYKDSTGKTFVINKPVGVKMLSEARFAYLKEYVLNEFQKWKNEGIITNPPQFSIKYYVGKTKWVGQPWCPEGQADEGGYNCTSKTFKPNNGTNNWVTLKSNNDKKYSEAVKAYKAEQSSSITITVSLPIANPDITTTTTTKKIDSKCATGLKLRVSVSKHNCNNAEFFVLANSTLLINSKGGNTANLNNASSDRGIPKSSQPPLISAEYLNPGYGKLLNGENGYSGNGDIGGERSDIFEVTPEQSASIISNGDGKISIYFVATTLTSHKNLPNFTITHPNKKENNGIVFNGKPNANKGLLLTLDGCGLNVVSKESNPEINYPFDITKLRTDLRSARFNLQSSSEGQNWFQKNKNKKNIDQKAIVQERASYLLENIIELANYLISKGLIRNLKGKPDIIEEIKQTCESYYVKFQENIKGDQQDKNNMDFTMSSDEFTNKTLRKDNMFEDVRFDLEKFYGLYNMIYYDIKSKEYVSTGNLKWSPIALKNLVSKADISGIG